MLREACSIYELWDAKYRALTFTQFGRLDFRACDFGIHPAPRAFGFTVTE